MVMCCEKQKKVLTIQGENEKIGKNRNSAEVGLPDLR